MSMARQNKKEELRMEKDDWMMFAAPQFSGVQQYLKYLALLTYTTTGSHSQNDVQNGVTMMMTPHRGPKCSSKFRCCNGVSAFHSKLCVACAAALCFHYLFVFNLRGSVMTVTLSTRLRLCTTLDIPELPTSDWCCLGRG